MFICAITKKPSAPREKMIRVVVETRPVTYVNIGEDEERKLSTGTEIVKEVGVTKAGFDILTKLMEAHNGTV